MVASAAVLELNCSSLCKLDHARSFQLRDQL
jgi:hypothetical protein